MTFVEYYAELQKREGHEPRILIDPWPTVLADEITTEITAAVGAQQVKGASCPIRPNSSNQSIGNQVEDFVVPKLAQGLAKIRLMKCTGAGYPDRVLVRENLKIPFEIKATAGWNPADSNRRVLTSSSDKIRRQFGSPIHHLLCTVFYSNALSGARIDAVRLDFLEPSSPVNVRLEASVSHRLLASGQHKTITI